MKRSISRAIAALRCGPLVALVLPLAAGAPAGASDLFERFTHIQHPVVASEQADDEGCREADPAARSASGYDMADYFPNLKMPPILDSTPTEDGEAAVERILHRDFAAVVERAKREAIAQARRGEGSVVASLPNADDERGSPSSLASFARPNCWPHSRRQQQCPPPGGMPAPQSRQARPAPTMPSQGVPSPTMPLPTTPSPTAPGAPQATTPDTPVVPLPDLTADSATVPAVPDLQRALPSERSLARADIGGGRATWSDAPNVVGDGCAPQGSAGRLAVGRSCVYAQNLTSSGPNTLLAPSAQIGIVTNGQFNNVQAVQQGLSSSSFTFPYQPQGAIPGSQTLTTGTFPTPGILGVPTPPSNYTAAANSAFQNTPPTQQYSNLNPQTVYDAANSGAVATGTAFNAYLYYNYVVDASVVLPGYAVGFVKLTENNSPIPRDRVYMTYSYFNNANFYPTKADVNRFMPGIEKTFLDGYTSIEVRTPFAATLSNSQNILPGGMGVSEYRDIEFGNMSVIFKTFLWEERTWAISGGIQVMLPTANNTFVNSTNNVPTATQPNGQPIQQIFVANESVHLMPFLGAIWAPNERFFNQVLVQYEKDANGNLAYVNNNFQTGISGRQLTQVGRIYYPDFLYVSLGTGYWLYKDNTQRFTGFSPIMELHVNQGLGAFCPIQRYGYQLGPDLGVVSVTNALVGCNFEWGERSTLTFAYVTPLGGGVDRFFDGELRALYNLRFGPQNRLTRAQF